MNESIEVTTMTPEEQARKQIDTRLEQSGWVVQDWKKVNPMISLGVDLFGMLIALIAHAVN